MKRDFGFVFKALLILLLSVSVCAITPQSALSAQPIIIDHTCTDINQIPESAIDQAKINLHIAYGHTSHGSQLITGMTGLIDFANNGGVGLALPTDIFAWNNGGAGGALDLHDYAMAGDVGYFPQWVNETKQYLDDPSHSDVNVIIWSWCGQVDDKYAAGTLDSEYLTPMSQLEAEYPGVRFVYMTGHVDHWDDADNKAANQMIRDYCTTNNKVLYDFADIESHDPDGAFYEFPSDNCDYYGSVSGPKLGNWAIEWQDSHTEGVDWYNCTSAHSQPLNANRKAYAAWWLWARLAGWNPDGVPVASFSGSPTTGTAPLAVSFTDSSNGVIDSWSWDFGDSGTSTSQSPTYTYNDTGTYTVTLEVAGPGGSDTRTRTNYISVTAVPQPPVANFSGAPTSGAAPLVVSFADSSTGEITGWSWDFGDGGTSTEQNPTYTYDVSGTYSVNLEVTGSGGSNTHIRTNYITVTDAQVQHTLTVNIVGEGSVTLAPGGGTYYLGTEVKLTPVSDAGWVFHGWSGDLSGYGNPTTLVMDTNKTITATFDEDSDDDGISDAEETACPNGGDGNSDGIQDSEQLNVASLHSQDGTTYVTLESGPGTILAECRAVAAPDGSGAPSGVTFPYDFFNFTINGVGAGGGATLTLYLPAGTDPTTYWKYGATPADANPHWYEFMYESATETGAEIDGNMITLHFVDGKRGDDIPLQDGMIIDQGGPGVSVSDSDESSFSGGGGGGGGGCFISTAAYGMTL